MKTPGHPPSQVPPESSIGDIAGQLVDDAKAYARAEVEVAKAMAGEKANAVKTPLILLVVALFVGMGALNALCIAIFVALATLMGPVLAGILAFILIGAVAATMAWIGYSRLRDAL